MVLSIVPYVGVFLFGIQYAYPAFRSLKTVEHPSEVSTVQWTTYWVICVLYQILESSLLFFLSDYFPLFLELKCVAFAWLVHPDFHGAAYLWYALIERPHKALDDQYYNLVMDKLPKPKKKDVEKSQKFDEAQDDEDD